MTATVEAHQVLVDLAAADPVAWDDGPCGDARCTLCTATALAGHGHPLEDPENHDPTCAWRRACELT